MATPRVTPHSLPHMRRPAIAARGELALAVGTVAMAAGAFLGHALVPDRIADHYGWPRQRWYQREIGAFNAGLGYGVIAYARGRREEAFVESWAVSAVLLAMTRAAALISGERRGIRNVATVIEDAALGLGALTLLTRRGAARVEPPRNQINGTSR